MSAELDALKWDEQGLIPAIAQDAQTGEVLMVAWMNRESLELTLKEGQAVYWSRSRRKLWRKGEESGHVQKIKAVRIDCDSDVVLLEVHQEGGIACHTGHRRCFYRRWQDGQWVETDAVVKDPTSIYNA
jgi:phosphoribosyl-AMP cyclohydrolase